MSNGASNRSFNSDIRPEVWDRTFADERETDLDPIDGGREEYAHDCEHCGRRMLYADQSCACTAKSNRIGYTGGQ